MGTVSPKFTSNWQLSLKSDLHLRKAGLRLLFLVPAGRFTLPRAKLNCRKPLLNRSTLAPRLPMPVLVHNLCAPQAQ
jgi:hypothetical protein